MKMKEDRLGLLWLAGVVLFFMFIGPLWELIVEGLNEGAVSPSVRAELKGSALELLMGFLVFVILLAVQLRILGVACCLRSLALTPGPLFAMLGIIICSAVLWWLNFTWKYFVPAPVFVILVIIVNCVVLYACAMYVRRRALEFVVDRLEGVSKQGMDIVNLRIFVASIWVNAAGVAFALRLVVAEFSFNAAGS